MPEVFLIAPLVLMTFFGMVIPLVFLGLIVYFLVQIKRTIDDVVLEMRDMRRTVTSSSSYRSSNSGGRGWES